MHPGVTIEAPPGAVWPWLVQAGCLRGGFYSNDLLDNLGRPSARTIILAALGVVLMEFGDFAMMRRMLLGVKDRAETLHRGPPPSPITDGARP